MFAQVSNYFKTLKGENAFWRANWIITPLEGISPFEGGISGGESEGKEVERSRISSEDQEEKEAALKVALVVFSFFRHIVPLYHLADGPPFLCKPPRPSSRGAGGEDGVPDHLQVAHLQLPRLCHPLLHRSAPYFHRVTQGGRDDCAVRKCEGNYICKFYYRII